MATTKREKPAAKRKRGRPRKNEGHQYPGYPLYSQEDDIMMRDKRVDQNLEDGTVTVSDANGRAGKGQVQTQPEESFEEEEVTQNESDVTKEDLEALGPKDLSLDMGDDEDLKHRTRPVDFSGEDLDVPGSEDDDEREKVGSEDEENNLYSQ